MSTEVMKQSPELSDLERVVIGGDLSRLTQEQRLQYAKEICDRLGLNMLTRPLEYITLQGKLTLYARKDATDQLRSLKKVSIKIVAREKIEDVYVVTAEARDAEGREDSSTGAVSVANLKGDFLANAMMKAETKAKRRVTLSICGLGILDETEVETIPGAVVHEVPSESQSAQQDQHEPRRPSDAQLRRLHAIKSAAHLTDEQLKAYSKEHFGANSSRDLTLPQYEALCSAMEAGKVQ